jgi:RNA polymerase sigma factor (sigma-70 family)
MATPQSQGPDWSEIVAQQGPPLLARARGALGREPHALVGWSADDVVDEVLTRVMREGVRYQGTEYQMRRYLQRRMDWVLSEVYAENKHRSTKRQEGQERPEGPPTNRSYDPLTEVEERLDDDQVLALGRAHFRCLTAKERVAFVEYIEKDRPTWEVAQEMDVTPQWVRRLAARAALKIQQCLKDPNHV